MHNGCKGRTTWGKNFLLRAGGGGGGEYTCRDCGGDGPTLVESERPRVMAEALVKSSQLPAISGGEASLEDISATSNSLGTLIASSGKGREESDAKSVFFASKEEMLSLLAGIVERSKREEMEEEMEDEQADTVRNETNFASEPEIGGNGRRKHLWIRKDLVANGDGEPLPQNICDSEESQMNMMPEPFQDDLEDVQEEMQVDEEEKIDEADLPGENPIRAIPPVKRTFGNKLLEMLEANRGMLRSKQKPQESYMSFFFKKINPERSPPAFDQVVKCSEQSVDRQNDLNSPQQPNIESEPIIETEQTIAIGKDEEPCCSKTT